MADVYKSIVDSHHYMNSIVPEQIQQQFKTLATNNDRIDFAYSFCKKHNILDVGFSKKEKCNMKSLELRNKGNAMFGAKNDLDAIKLYTESIAYAENGSSYLGLAYANRSAVLFENRYYEECLKDISRALKNNYPQDLLKKIVGRQKRAESLRGASKRSISYCDPPPDIPQQKSPYCICI
ncbi:hypothetical protein NQ317_011676 [Molorchus minor]|uniref:Uncharacterized protein n=1 Tax=Molorchus minor TaxID=1323400 RepID=A0ABQ9JG04_9CUCU|nr:hypothetical protein NQ317_011676 [Molorchus minor]